MKNSIAFAVSDSKKPLEIQLEPEAHIFIVKPSEELMFVPTTLPEDFHWLLRINPETTDIQLFPVSEQNYGEIEIYKNGILDEDWTSLK